MGWSRRDFMVPLPRFASFEALNLSLEQRCREPQGDVLRGHRESIATRLERDLEAMTALPGAPFDACHQAADQVSSQSLVPDAVCTTTRAPIARGFPSLSSARYRYAHLPRTLT